MQIAGSIIICLLLAFGLTAKLYLGKVEDAAVLEDREAGYLKTIDVEKAKLEKLKEENNRKEELLLEANQEKEQVNEKLSFALSEIYEIKNSNEPGAECLSSDMPDSLVMQLQSATCEGTGEQNGVCPAAAAVDR